MNTVKYFILVVFLLLAGCFGTKAPLDVSQTNANGAPIDEMQDGDISVNQLVATPPQYTNRVTDIVTVEDIEGAQPEEASRDKFSERASGSVIKLDRRELPYINYSDYDAVEAERNTPQDQSKLNRSFIRKLLSIDQGDDFKAADANNFFQIDNVFVYNNVPMALLKLKSSAASKEAANKRSPALKYLTNAGRDGRIIDGMPLSKIHQVLLDELVSRASGNEKIVIIIYSHPNDTTNWLTADDYKDTRVVYLQTMAVYLYQKIPNLRIDYRYIKEMPWDEIAMSIFGYDGTLPFNVYTIARTKGTDWLSANMKIRLDMRNKQLEAKKSTQDAISNLGK